MWLERSQLVLLFSAFGHFSDGSDAGATFMKMLHKVCSLGTEEYFTTDIDPSTSAIHNREDSHVLRVLRNSSTRHFTLEVQQQRLAFHLPRTHVSYSATA